MRALHGVLVGLVLLSGSGAPAADKSAVRPHIDELAPRRLHAPGALTVRGGGFGKDTPGRALRMRIGGHGLGAVLAVTRWTPAEVDVVIPKGTPAGRYYVGVADARNQWVSGIDQTFEVLPEVRDVAASLEIMFRCHFDVLAAPPAITVLLTPAGGGSPVSATLALAGPRPGANGAVFYRYDGRFRVRPGAWALEADRGSRFDVNVWDVPDTYWLTPQCFAHRRVGESGAPLAPPVRQSRSVTVTGATARVTDDTHALAFLATMPTSPGSLEPPTPVKVK